MNCQDKSNSVKDKYCYTKMTGRNLPVKLI